MSDRQIRKGNPVRSYEPLQDRSEWGEALSLRLFMAVLAVALLGTPLVTDAGALGKSVAKAAAARLGRTTGRATIIPRIAKTNTAGVIYESERTALQQQFRRLDRQALARIEKRFGAYIDPQRMQHARSTQTRFLNHDNYQRQLSHTYPDLPASTRQNIIGNYVNGRTYVDRNQMLVPRTLAHERIHQLADPRIRQHVGSRLDEGMTEYFAGRIYGDLWIRDLPTVYPGQRRIVQMIVSRLGERPLARAYFGGEAGVLRKQMDRQLGTGAFENIVREMERGNYGAVAKILHATR